METSENTLREFPLVIATVAKVPRMRGLWLVVRVNRSAGICLNKRQDLTDLLCLETVSSCPPAAGRRTQAFLRSPDGKSLNMWNGAADGR